MNSNALNCFNKLIMHGAFLLKLFSNYHQTSIDINTKYEHYRVNVHFFFFFILVYSIFPLHLFSQKKEKKRGFPLYLSIPNLFIYIIVFIHQ